MGKSWSFEDPTTVQVTLQEEKIRISPRKGSNFEFQYTLPAWSATVLELREKSKSS